MSKGDFSYIGKGRVFAKEVGAAVAFEIGNCSVLEFQPTSDKKELSNYKVPGGGLANSLERIKNVTVNMTLHDLDSNNLAMLLRGTASTATSSPVVSEPHTAYVGGLVRLAGIGPTSVTVTGSGGTPSYVADTDYEVTNGGIVPLAGGAITDGLAIEVSYTNTAASIINALTNSGKEYELTFDGLNEARSDKAVVVDVYRFKPGVFSSLPYIADDFAGVPLTGEVLQDSTKTGAGISQYFKHSYVE